MYNTARNGHCGFCWLDAGLLSSCMKCVGFIKLYKVCEKQARYNLIFADLLQVVETTCIKLVDKKSCQRILISACSRLAATCAFLAV